MNTFNRFADWQAAAIEDPEKIADQFLGKYDLLPPETQRAFIASYPDRDIMIQGIKAGSAVEKSPIAGVPYMLQDMFDVDGLATRCGAPFQDPFEPLLDDASLLHQKLKSVGGALIAKTVPSEFGVDSRGQNPSFGDCPHAQGIRFICGGGSGASAHAVKDNWVPIAFGLDSCAGVRIPAAFHGLFGFRMGNNAYSREGVFPIIPSIESIGWMTNNAEDLITSIEVFHANPKSFEKLDSPRGYLLSDPSIRLDPDLKTGLMNLVRQLDIEEHPETNKQLCNTFKTAGQSLNRIQSRELYSIHQYWVEEYRDKYDEGLLRLIESGQICTIQQAERAATDQQKIREAMVEFFDHYDFLVIPISPLATPQKTQWSGQLENDLLRLNAPTSLSFLPSIILPFPCKDRLHSAVQIIVNPRQTALCRAIIEQALDFYKE